MNRIVTVIVLGLLSQALFGFSRKSETVSAPPESRLSDAVSVSSNDSVWVARGDGGQSCSPKSGQALEAGAGELQKAQVRVLESRKGDDGKMRAQMCGLPTGKLNAYRIPREDLGRAVALGFLQQKQN
jgi:hypothetical protein